MKYPADFTHFDYVNPDAPKGGTFRRSAIGTFDTLNPFNIKGTPAAAATQIYDSLMTTSVDEPSSEYGLIAEAMVTVTIEEVYTAPTREELVTMLEDARKRAKPGTIQDAVARVRALRDEWDD